MKVGTDLTTGSIFKKYIYFVIPLIASGYLQQLYSVMDSVVVGRFVGEAALAAVGSTYSITALIVTVFTGIPVGTNVVCAKFFGEGNKEGLHRAVHTSMLLALILGVPLMLIGWFGSRSVLLLMGTPESVIDQAVLYMRTIFCGIPVDLLANFGFAIIRAMGDSKKPFYILACTGLINVVLNVVFVTVVKWDVFGVALATVISKGVSTATAVFILARTNEKFRLRWSKLRIYKKELINIVKIGLPGGLIGVFFSSANVTIQSAINSFGENAIAGVSIAGNVDVFGFLLLSAAESGIIGFIGQNLGAKKLDRAEKAISLGMVFSFVAACLFAVVVFVAGKLMLSVFTDDAEVIAVGMMEARMLAVGYILYSMGKVLNGALRGFGRATLPMVIDLICVCLVRVLWISFVFPLRREISTVLVVYPITLALTGMVTLIAYLVLKKRLFRKEREKMLQYDVI